MALEVARAISRPSLSISRPSTKPTVLPSRTMAFYTVAEQTLDANQLAQAKFAGRFLVTGVSCTRCRHGGDELYLEERHDPSNNIEAAHRGIGDRHGRRRCGSGTRCAADARDEHRQGCHGDNLAVGAVPLG